MDSLRDHLVPQISKKMTTRKMFKTLKLFEHSSSNVTLALRNKQSNMKMTKFKSIASYFMRITELRDKLRTSGDNIKENELVVTTLNGIPSSKI